MKKRPASKVVSFRLESKLAARLHKKAIAQRLSLNQYVREITIDALVQQDLRDDLMELHHEVRDLGADIEGLRHDLARVLSMFLVELSDWDEEAARNWILDRFSGVVDDSFDE